MSVQKKTMQELSKENRKKAEQQKIELEKRLKLDGITGVTYEIVPTVFALVQIGKPYRSGKHYKQKK